MLSIVLAALAAASNAPTEFDTSLARKAPEAPAPAIPQPGGVPLMPAGPANPTGVVPVPGAPSEAPAPASNSQGVPLAK